MSELGHTTLLFNLKIDFIMKKKPSLAQYRTVRYCTASLWPDLVRVIFIVYRHRKNIRRELIDLRQRRSIDRIDIITYKLLISDLTGKFRRGQFTYFQICGLTKRHFYRSSGHALN